MATVALHRSTDIALRVARSAGNALVRTSQGKSRFVVIECRRSPVGRRMAYHAVVIEVPLSVIGIFRRRKFVAMAIEAGHWCAGEPL